MLIDEGKTREVLSRIVCRLTNDSSIREDLMQEAMVHLWLLEAKRPGQTSSWYLQGCKFHLQNYLGAGRSVDSLKRKAGKLRLNDEDEDFEALLHHEDVEEDFFAKISARDILECLGERLTGFELEVLGHLAQGLGARCIAEQLGVTHPTIIKYRRRIAAEALRLGIDRLPQHARAAAAA